MTITIPKLFTPAQVGKASLKHRVVLAALTRFRAHANHVPSEIAIEYYTQRASVPGTLLITEGVFIAPQAGGLPHAPGIWSDEQIAGWKRITDAVHRKGSYIFAQLWALGRQAIPSVLEAEGPHPYVSASDIKLKDSTATPRPLTSDEVKEYVQLYATAAYNAVHRAGFDGIEIHGANGYLVDQFIQDVTNQRTDEYGSSVENRSRFPLEIIAAIAEKIGEDRVAIRLSPWSSYGDMRMSDPIPQFSHLVQEIANRHPALAYLHVIEPRVSGIDGRDVAEGESNDFIRQIWRPRRLISAGGYSRERALEVAETTGELIAFGRYFISNPDLPLRLMNDIPLTKYNRDTFYVMSPTAVEGYIDYPTAEEAMREVVQVN